MTEYSKIFKEHKGKVSWKGAHYFYIYDKVLSRIINRNKPMTILEIGVLNGGSLEIWKKYLPEGSIIHGLDINPECNKLKFEENICFHLGDATDIEYLEKEFSNERFDVILDDGSHLCNNVIKTFELLWPKVKDGGVYMVEDLCTSYWKNCGGGYKKARSTVEYFKNIADAVNGVIKPKNCFIGSHMKEIAQISFFLGVLAIDKYYQKPISDAFGALITGNEMDILKLENEKHMSELETRLEYVKKMYTGE